MDNEISQNTQAILLLTAPLNVGKSSSPADILTFGEYKKLARFLFENNHQPSDLISPDADKLIEQCDIVINKDRIKRLLNRGFLLSQAIERWHSRSIWVVSRADSLYPSRLKKQLKGETPPIIYGCGDRSTLEGGGLAIVGSRNVDESFIQYTEDIGKLAARSGCTIISGGAKGIDRAAMTGALQYGGKTVGVLADSLERAVLNRENRNYLMDKLLVLISPYDPLAGFNVGNAMQRNKLIYALSDVALVVNTDYQKGGTWAGAVEQLDKLRLVPIYVRSSYEYSKGIEVLKGKGALTWTNPSTTDELLDIVKPKYKPVEDHKIFAVAENIKIDYETQCQQENSPTPQIMKTADLSELPILQGIIYFIRTSPKTYEDIAKEFNISLKQAKTYLKQLHNEGAVEKLLRPVRYRAKYGNKTLFDDQ